MPRQRQEAVSEPVMALWQSVPYFEGLDPQVIQELAQAAVRHACPAGHMIFTEGEPSTGLYLIEAGTVKISRFSREGREHILHLLNRGDTFNDVAALDGGPNPATATAFTDAVVWHLDRGSLRQAVDRHPALAWALIESMARRARYLLGLVEDLSMRNVRGRLARLLLEEASRHEADQVPRLLTQEEMASRLGTVREVVGRALRSLAAEGLIEFDRHRIVILDAAGLAREAEA
ncbi:Crp/Fnr family transcriptional regulator [Litorilinea aerophila]|nr:Crp/Fnr family transcriptional regulator [Litorilinea aerophila]MCC9076119.1 Crp/Fnr family transcriptional regulator [Litorilinea aerophila]GIV78816.1 MAG: Crp/Fnr family transcriptional regulator [Litorilinea sp.]